MAKNLNLLPILVAIYEEESLSRASEKLNLSQPALSHSLGKLRHEFDDPLFVRSSHGLSPTPRATEIVFTARPLLEKMTEVYTTKGTDLQNLTREFILASTAYFEVQVIQSLVHDLGNTAPNVVLRTHSLVGEPPVRSIDQGEVDLSVGAYFGDLPSSLRLKKLQSDPIVCLVRKKHPYLRVKNRLESYLSYQHINIAVPQRAPQGIDIALAKKGRSRNIPTHINNFLTPPMLCKDSDRIITCPFSLASHYKRQHDLVITPPPIPVPPIFAKMIWHERYQNDPLHRFVRAAVEKTFAAATKPT